MSVSTNPPYKYNFINTINSVINPSAIHTKNTMLFNYYVRYLIQKVISVYNFEGLPENWSESYFKYVLFCFGFIAVFNDPRYGTIPQECTLSDTMTLFHEPDKVLVVNPIFSSTKEMKIGKDCELLKLQPDYGGIGDIVSIYADLLAVALETANVNLMNSKASFVFFAHNKAVAETYKKMYDELAAGKPFSVVDKNLLNEDGTHNWDFFVQNVGQNYITDRVLNDMKSIEDQFNTKIGIPNANTQKRERLISDEVNANDVDTKALVNVWLDTMQDGIRRINDHYGLNLSVRYRYEKEADEQWQPE